MSSQDYSVVEYYAEHERYRCGYCKSTDTNYSHGMWAHSMTVQDYQDLIDRGWRRSGRYCYKPIMNATCCPMYTIKCSASDFKLSKSQKKVLKRFHRFLSCGNTKRSEDAASAGGSSETSEPPIETFEVNDVPDLHQKSLRAEKNVENAKVMSIDPSLLERTGNSVNALNTSESLKDESQKHNELSRNVDNNQLPGGGDPLTASDSSGSLGKAIKAGVGQDTSRPPCKKAKLMRLERKKQKLAGQGYSQVDVEKLIQDGKKQPAQGKSLEDFLNENLPENSAHKLEIRLVRSSPPSLEFSQTSHQSHELYQKYQMAVHGDAAEKCTNNQYTRFLVTSPLQLMVVSVDSAEFIATLAESQELYAKYQIAVHKETPEECNIKTFCEFLVDSPLQSWTPSNGPPQGYGSFHQQYWLDGRLIAVGVVDILPHCLSSVYFYYDPELGQLSLGTYASLRELSLVRSLHQYASELQYYYMGFYIHSCPKMRYKASYSPSRLLCPETYTWHHIEKCQRKLDNARYCRFEEDPSATDADGVVSVNEVLVLSHHRAMPYFLYLAMNRGDANDTEDTRQYAALVGMKCAKRILLVKN